MNISGDLYFLAVPISFVFPLIEFIGMGLYIPFLFRIGIIVKYIKVDIDLDRFKVGSEYETENAKFKRVSKNSCLIRHRDLTGGYHMPFIIKSEILRRKSGTFLIWRVPFGTFLPFIVFLLPLILNGWFPFLAIYMGTLLAIDLFFVPIEWDRARIEFFEVKNGEFAL